MYRGVFGTLSSDQHISLHRQLFCTTVAESESRSLVSDSLRPRGLHCPWNSPGQSPGVDSLSLLQGIFPTQVSRIAGGFFTSRVAKVAVG